MRKINERFQHLVSSSGKKRQTTKRNKEAEKRRDEKEATTLNQRNFKNESQTGSNQFHS